MSTNQWFLLASLFLSLQLFGQKNAAKKDVYEFFPSDHVDPRRVDVYLPAGYPSQAPYNVIYMHDGQNLSDDSSSEFGKSWHADSILFELLQLNQISPTILVGIWSTKSKFREYAPMPCFTSLSDSTYAKITRQYGGISFSERYLTFIVDELKPHIDAYYKTESSSKSTSIIGSNLGGLISLYAICRYPNTFGSAGCISTDWVVSSELQDPKLFNNFHEWLKRHLPNDHQHRIYFDYGTLNQDSINAPNQQKINELFHSSEFDDSLWSSVNVAGSDHNEVSWGIRLKEIFKYVLTVKFK